MVASTVVIVRPPRAIRLKVGGMGQARIEISVAEGYHVQANPASDEFLIPLQLQLRGTGGVRPGKSIYPSGQPYRLQGASADLMTYEGNFEVMVPLKAAASARPGHLVLEGVLRYQACDSRTCLFPASLPVALPVQVTAERERQGRRSQT